ncbi:MAG: crosslink repair DNA glycosylase YcaQ family protein [Terriglobales bacterium]
MFENELQDLRRFQWRVDTSTRAIFTVDDAREFLHNVGFCLEYPLRSPVLAPTFIGAVIGSDQNLPTAKYAFIHPRAKEATEFKDRLLREKAAFEAGFGEDDNLLISAIEFPYFYALIGDRNPKVPPSAGERGERLLLQRAFELIQEHGPILETALRERLGETVSDVALSRTLSELRQKLRIVRIEDTGGPLWDLLMRWSPQVVNQGKQISAQEALSALVGKYLETCVAAEQKDIEEFFGHLVPRSRVAEVIKALLSAREFSYVQINGKNLLRNSPRISAEEKAAQIAAAAAPKPEGRANRSFQPRSDGGEPKRNVWEKYGPKKDRRDFDKRPKREDGSWIKPEEGAPAPAGAGRFEKSGARFQKSSFPKKAWKKDGPPRPWQKPAGDAGTGERSFRPAGDDPPKRFGAPREGKREWTKPGARSEGRPEARTSNFGAKPAWKKTGDLGEREPGFDRKKKFGGTKFGAGRPEAGGPRKEWKPRAAGAAAAAPKREFKKFDGPKKFGGPKTFGAPKKFGAKKFGAKKFGDRDRPEGPRKEWKKRPDSKEFGASRFKAKFGVKKPWEKSASSESTGAESGASAGAPTGTEGAPVKKAPFKKAGFKKTPFKKTGSFAKPGAKAARPFKKAGQAGDGFKKPFKKPFKKALGKKTFAKKPARPGFGGKPRPGRPA